MCVNHFECLATIGVYAPPLAKGTNDAQTRSWAGRGQVDEKRPSRALEELPQVAATRAERRPYIQVAANDSF